MRIRLLDTEEAAPMHLLLLADPSEILIKDYLASGQCYVLESEESEIVGTFFLQLRDTIQIELVNVAVSEAYQGHGFGRMLVEAAIETARNQSYQQLLVCTGNSSIGQLALYQKCGFRIESIERDYFIHHYSEVIIENGIQCRDRICLVQSLSEG